MDLDVACHLNVVAADASPDALATALPALRTLGYRRVVLPPLDPGAVDVAPIAALFERHDVVPITIAGQGPGADVSSDDPDERRAGADALRAVVDLTASLGGDQMNGVPYGVFGHPTRPLSPEAFERAAREVGIVADYAADQGIAMTFEVLNRYETSAVNTAERALLFAEVSGSPNLGIHLDTFHMAVEEADMAGAIRLALPRLRYLELGQSGRGSLAHGAVDLAEVVRGALDAGYAGRWGVEAFSRSVLPEGAADLLAVWGVPYADGLDVAADALRIIGKGWSASSVGRRDAAAQARSRT